MTLWEILKANKTGIAPDMFTMLAASKMNGGRDRLHELSGIPPLSFTAKGKPLTAWSITGNTVQNGTPTPDTPQEVKAVGDRTGNLLNFEDLIAAPSGLMPDGQFTFPHLLILYLKPNTTYTCASSGTGSITSTQSDLTRSIYFCRTDGQGSVNVSNPVTYTTDSTGRVFIGFINHRTNAQQYLNKTAYIWLNEGSTPLPYEPYGYKIPVATSADGTEPITTPIYLDKPLYKIGNYADSINYAEQKVERRIKELVLTGEEMWIKSSAYKGSFYAQIVTGILSETYTAFCSHLAFSTLSRYAKGKFCFNGGNVKNCNLWLNQFDSSTTVDDFKAYLSEQYAAGTPVKVYYVLATPETETFTAPQIPTLNGTTVIDVDTAVKPESMTIKYRR